MLVAGHWSQRVWVQRQILCTSSLNLIVDKELGAQRSLVT